MRHRSLVLGVLALVLVGCAGRQAVLSGPAGQHGNPGPRIRQTGEVPVQWTRVFWGALSNPNAPVIVAGADGNMWYTDNGGGNLIRMNMNAGTKVFPLVYSGSSIYHPTALTVGSDGKFYMGSQSAGLLGVMTTGGTFKTVTIPSGDFVSYDGMTLGPDGNVWFAELAHVGKVTTTGAVTEFAWSDGSTNNYYSGITTGSDGNLWATEYSAQSVMRINPTTGAMKQFSLTANGCSPTGIVSASDGNLWLNCSNSSVLARLTTAGVVTTFPNAFGNYFYAGGMTKGPDGNPWMASTVGHAIAEFNTATNSLIAYVPPTSYGNAIALAAGPDGNMWAVDDSSEIDVYMINVISVSPATINFTATGQTQTITVTEPGTSSWTATSTHTSVATVAAGSSASQFKVTSVASGYAKILVSDAVGNSFIVRVHVP